MDLDPHNLRFRPYSSMIAPFPRGQWIAPSPVQGGLNMSSFTHILFPVDFSERCEAAVPFVECMARRNRAKVTLLSVAHPYYPAVMEAPLVDPQELLQE